MTSSISSRRRKVLLAAAVALTVWAVAGYWTGIRMGWVGPYYNTDYVVEYVEPGGPMEGAGLEPGDRVVSVEGRPVEELGMYSRWPRSLSRRSGESLNMVVERGGEQVSVEIVYGAMSKGAVRMRLGAVVVGLSFLWFGMLALFTAGTGHALRLAHIGIAAALAIPGVYLGSWDGVATHIQIASMALITLLMVRFFFTFPSAKRPARSRLFPIALYLPWTAVLICQVVELICHPRYYHTFGWYGSLLMMAYVVLVLGAILHTLVTTSRPELTRSGMTWILAGLVVGLIPSLVSAVLPALRVSLPGALYYPMLVGLIPLSMALAVRKQAMGAAKGN